MYVLVNMLLASTVCLCAVNPVELQVILVIVLLAASQCTCPVGGAFYASVPRGLLSHNPPVGLGESSL